MHVNRRTELGCKRIQWWWLWRSRCGSSRAWGRIGEHGLRGHTTRYRWAAVVGDIRGRREQPARRALLQCAGEALGFFVGVAFLKGKLDFRFVSSTAIQYVLVTKR